MDAENHISTKICKKCAGCCKNYPFVELSNDKINTLELMTGLQSGTFTNSKARPDGGYFLRFKENGYCFFLSEINSSYSCDIYEARPEICKNYPSNPRQQEICNSNRQKFMCNKTGLFLI